MFSCEHYIEVARIPLNIPSPASFVIYPALIIKMGASGKITGEISVKSTNTLEYSCSLSYTENNGSGWDRINSFIGSFFDEGETWEQGDWRGFSYSKFDSELEFESKAKLELKGYFTPKLRIVLPQYRKADIGIELENYLKFQAENDFGSNKINWDFGYGMEAKGLIKFTLVDDSFVKVDFENTFWEKPYTKFTEGTIELPEKVFEGDVYLTTQQEVDDFGANNYTVINGFLYIGSTNGNGTSSDPIIDLTKLNTITLSNYLVIAFNNYLTSLKGLNLREVLEVLQIHDNPLLTNLNGLEKLKSISNSNSIESLLIANNNGLVNLDGIENLDYVNGVTIRSNNSLINFCALTSLINNNGLNGNLIIGGYSGGMNWNNAFNPTLQDLQNGNCSQ